MYHLNPPLKGLKSTINMQRRKAARMVFLEINKELEACLHEDFRVRIRAVARLKKINENLGDSIDELIIDYETRKLKRFRDL